MNLNSCLFNPFPNSRGFLRICSNYVFGKHCGKRRNSSSQAISPFPTVFFTLLENCLPFHQIQNCLLQTLSGLEESKIFLGERVKVLVIAVSLFLVPYRPGWLSGECVRLMTWWLWVRSQVEATFLSGVFSPLTSAEACEKSSRWLWKKSSVSTGVRKPGNTYASPTAMIWL